jgi:hypothetical protein
MIGKSILKLTRGSFISSLEYPYTSCSFHPFLSSQNILLVEREATEKEVDEIKEEGYTDKEMSQVSNSLPGVQMFPCVLYSSLSVYQFPRPKVSMEMRGFAMKTVNTDLNSVRQWMVLPEFIGT